MKKILYLTLYDQDGTFYYRQMPLEYINHPEITVERKPYMGNIGYSFFAGYTHLFLERPSSYNDLLIIKLAKQMGLKIILDYDDDCIHLDQFNPMYAFYEQDRKNVLECITLADEIWVSTAGIKKSFQLFNSKIQVIPNAHNDLLFPMEQKRAFNPETKKAIWRGGGSHEADVYENVNELINVINDNLDWSFYFIGCRFIYMEQRCGKNYWPVSNMPLMQYFDHLNTENPNVVFHPLSNTLFNKSKSNIAWLEATYAGAAFFGNTELSEFKERGFDFKSLSDFIQPDFINDLQRMNENSWKLIQSELLLSKVNERRIERILAV